MVADPPESWLWRRTRGSTTPNRTIPSGIPQNLTVRLHLDFGIILIWSRLMSRLCIGARSGQIAVPITGRNSFSSCLLSRRRATECNYLDGMHHLHHRLLYLLPGAARIFCSQEEANQWPDSADHCRMRFGSFILVVLTVFGRDCNRD